VDLAIASLRADARPSGGGRQHDDRRASAPAWSVALHAQQVVTGQVPVSVVLTAMNSAQVLAAVTARSVRRCP
jgi:hypothetical protein